MEKIRLAKSSIGEEEKIAIVNVLNHEYLGMGDDVRLFEEELKFFLQTQSDVVCVNTGTAALHLALLGMGIAEGDEVLVPTITYVASFQAISATGATPVACDVRDDTLFIDLSDARSRITHKTKAIMPVHYASNTDGMSDVYSFANEFGLRVIEDAAHSFGCARNGKYVGNSGDVICFSFDGIKNITSGEGGAIITSDEDLARKVRDARLLGVINDTEMRYKGQRSWAFDVTSQGFRYHMSNLMASIGRAQLKKFDQVRIKRQRVASLYIKNLKHLPGIELLPFNYGDLVPHIFVIKIKNGQRNPLKEYLAARQIETGIHYLPNHFLTKYKTSYKLSNAEKIFGQILSLPIHLDMTDDLVQRVIYFIREFFNDL